MTDISDFIHGLYADTTEKLAAEDYDSMTLEELEACLGIEGLKLAEDIEYQGSPNNGDPSPRQWPEAALGVESAGRRATAAEESAQSRTATPQHVEPSSAGDRLKQAVSNAWVSKHMRSGLAKASPERATRALRKHVDAIDPEVAGKMVSPSQFGKRGVALTELYKSDALRKALDNTIKSSGLRKLSTLRPGQIFEMKSLLHPPATSGAAVREGFGRALAQHTPKPRPASGGSSLSSILKRQAAEKAQAPVHSAPLFAEMAKTQAMKPEDLAKHLAKKRSQTAAARAAVAGAAGSGVRPLTQAVAEAPHVAVQKARYLARSGGGPLSTFAGVA